MKRLLAMVLMAVLVAGVSWSLTRDQEVELEKIKAYIKVLDQKIEVARKAKQVNKMVELREMKRVQMERAEKLRSGQPVGGRALGGWQAGAGFAGGGLLFDFGYLRPMERFDLLLGAGYGMGNNYSIMKAGGAAVFGGKGMFWGLEAGAANYSKSVTNVPGVSGNINSGTNFGFGLFVGKNFGAFSGEIGYNTALGTTVSLFKKL